MVETNMEEIKVGEYVRTKGGIIGKVYKIEISGQGTRYCGERLEDTVYCLETNENEEHYRYRQQAISKHSPNLIALIEVGDYVNGYKVEKVENGFIYVDYCWDCSLYTMVTDKVEDIKTIVTHQQFKSVMYEV